MYTCVTDPTYARFFAIFGLSDIIAFDISSYLVLSEEARAACDVGIIIS